MPHLADPENINFYTTDTDSLVHDIKDTNISAAIRNNIQYFNTPTTLKTTAFNSHASTRRLWG